jgi:hypothetical protein
MIRANYRVTGYDDEGKHLFSVTVEATSVTAAELLAFAQIRKRPDGKSMVSLATRVETKRDI